MADRRRYGYQRVYDAVVAYVVNPSTRWVDIFEFADAPVLMQQQLKPMLESLEGLLRDMHAATTLDEATSAIVRQLNKGTAADACSIYLVGGKDRIYELTASDGLESARNGRNPVPCEALVRLVGERREPLNVEDTSLHPRCQSASAAEAARLRAFLGAPIIQSRKVLGVLVLQRRQAEAFSENTVSVLVTVAAQLAGPLSDMVADSPIEQGADSSGSTYLQGLPGAPGTATGTMVAVSSSARLEAIPYREAGDPEAEERAFRTAVARVQEELQAGGARMAAALSSDERALFDAYVMLSGSETIVNDTVRRIREGYWAPGALRETIAAHARAFEDMNDPYLRSRANDIWDIGAHILARLQSDAREARRYPALCVLFGENVTVAEMADVPLDRLCGIVCSKGSGVSHTAILAHALGIPAVMGLRRLPPGHLDGREIIVDGHQGRVYIEPSPAVRDEYRRLARQEEALASAAKDLRHLPAETADGTRIGLYVNSGLLSDVPAALSSGAEGVGLYRTEFGFMVRTSFPSQEEQYRSYRRILLLFAPKPVGMRTLDIGGDKMLPYFSVAEDNPALGWRGIRVTLDHPEIFITQLRAMLRANAGLNNLSLLLPMVTRVAEVDEAMALLDRVHKELREERQPCARPRVGVMVETPAAACQVSMLARRVDFFSIGTNDLTQHLLVVDRHNPRVAELYDSLHPAVLRTIHRVVEEAHEWGRPVSVCGEMAGDPAAIVLFVGMGVDTLSASAADLPRAKQVVRALLKREAQELLRKALAMEDPAGVRSLVADVLANAGVAR